MSSKSLPPALVKTIDSLPISSALILIGLLTEHCLRLSLIPSISPLTAASAPGSHAASTSLLTPTI